MENRRGTEPKDIKVIVLCLVLSSVIFALDSFLPLGIAGGVPYILVVLISLWSPRRKLPIYMAIVGSILTIIGFYLSLPGEEVWKAFINRTLALFGVWTTAILSNQRMIIQLEKEDAVSKLKILSGLLPICASCKKIRDDDGYWNQIEAYITDHSEAEFSHGICPQCKIKLYPDLYSENKVDPSI